MSRPLRKEAEIQKWLESLVSQNGASIGIHSALRFNPSPLGLAMRAALEGFTCEDFDPAHGRVAHESLRVLRGLRSDPTLRSADANIAPDGAAVLRPDLVLQEADGGAFIVVEVKRSKATAREFATEMLAYANCLTRSPGAEGGKVFLVLISSSWAGLERHAFDHLLHWNIPCLPLEYREEADEGATPSLLLRCDLLGKTPPAPFPSSQLMFDTRVFFLPQQWERPPKGGQFANRAIHAIAHLAREADRSHVSGFIIAAYDGQRCDPQTEDAIPSSRLFIFMGVRNHNAAGTYVSPLRNTLPDRATSDDEELDLAFARAHDPYFPYDDTAVRLLHRLDPYPEYADESVGAEGTWPQLEERLVDEGFNILCFEPFGLLADAVQSWRTEQRFSLAPMVRDIALFPEWHPITWVPAVDELIDTTQTDHPRADLWRAYRQGLDLSAQRARQRLRGAGSRDYNAAVAHTRFLRTWCRDFAHLPGAPRLRAYGLIHGNVISLHDSDAAANFAAGEVRKTGELQWLSLCLGFHEGAGTVFREMRLVRLELEGKGMHLPEQLLRVALRNERSIDALGAIGPSSSLTNSHTVR